MSWNRQYRPKKIKDLHLKNVREFFLSLMKAGTMPQVFLFAGSKGTGKTSTARILAALLNDPENDEAVKKIFFQKEKNTKALVEPSVENELTARIYAGSSFVVSELDAASNRGIDDVRALKERIGLPPHDGIMAVYILDEVHMLTTEAFNALLKILEEPPPHVVFILATTELDKIPATITSRAQVIRFTKATPAELVEALEGILKAEKLSADATVLEAIALQADGSFRDAVKLLEMIAQVGAITVETAESVLHLSLKSQISELVRTLIEKNAAGVVKVFEELRKTHTDAKQLHAQILQYLHQHLLIGLGVSEGKTDLPIKSTQFLLKELADPTLSAPCPIAFLQLEIRFLELIDRATKKPTPPTPTEPTRKPKPQESPKSTTVTAADIVTSALNSIGLDPSFTESDLIVSDSIPATPSLSTIASSFDDTVSGSVGDGQAVCDRWNELINLAVTQNFGLATLLKAAKPISGERGKITLSVYYKFHQEQLMQPKFKKLLDTLFIPVAGGTVQLFCVLAEQPASAELQETQVAQNLTELAAASLM